MVDVFNIVTPAGSLNDVEVAYRRGCQQALDRVKRMLADPRVKQLNAKPEEVIDFCAKWTDKARYEAESLPWFLDLMMRDVVDAIANEK